MGEPEETFSARHRLRQVDEDGGMVRAGCSCGERAARAHPEWHQRSARGWHRVHKALMYALGEDSNATPTLRQVWCQACDGPALEPGPDGDVPCPHARQMTEAMRAIGVNAFGWRPQRRIPDDNNLGGA